MDFWFDSIHCLSTCSPEERPTIPKGYSKHRLYPPVIVVCTHIDEYKSIEEVQYDDYNDTLFLSSYFKG